MDGREPTGRKRLAWFVVLYGASIVAFFALVYGLRAIVPR